MTTGSAVDLGLVMPEGNGNLPGVPVIKIRKKDPAVILPAYETEGAAGMDIRAFLSGEVRIPPMGRAKIPSGLFMEIPGGYEIQVRPRSGLAIRSGVTVLNAPGTIDSDYRGEVEIILVNLGTETFTVKSGDRIAQLVAARVFKADIAEVLFLSETPRGEEGFGSTGI